MGALPFRHWCSECDRFWWAPCLASAAALATHIDPKLIEFQAAGADAGEHAVMKCGTTTAAGGAHRHSTRPPTRAARQHSTTAASTTKCPCTPLRTRSTLTRWIGCSSGGLVELAPQVRNRHLAAIADMSLDAGRGRHPRLCNSEHEVAVARVVGFVRPAQAVEREQAHLFGGGSHCGGSGRLGAGALPSSQSPTPRDEPLPVMVESRLLESRLSVQNCTL